MKKNIPLRSIKYQWESMIYRDDVSRKTSFDRKFGTKVISRNDDLTANLVEFFVYANDPFKEIFLVGSFNEWGKKNLDDFKLTVQNDAFQILRTDKVKHKDPYLFLVRKDGHEEVLRDVASFAFDDDGNSIFWDFEDPTAYKKEYPGPDTLHRATKIIQTDLPGLVSRWFELNKDTPNTTEYEGDLFTYIKECGVIEKVKDLGFNTIQFLPVGQSIDGDNWKFRYLVPYPFAVHKDWGDPDSFMAMIDEFHKHGIAVIVDLILSHCPHVNYKIFGFNGEDVGPHKWLTQWNEPTFLQDYTPWGSMRFRYGDENVRRYLTESALHFSATYGVDGFRIDNVDGILRLGDHGQGDERAYGRQFMRELIADVYDINPLALIHLESHYFYGDNAKMLVHPQALSDRALGATAYNSSRITYYFHKEVMPKSAEEISVWKFENIREEKEWGASNSTIADFHNHDAAAGLMHGRATGSYAYDALILKNPSLHFHAVGKIKFMEAIIAFGCEGRILDLLQSFLLQMGTFEHDSSIHWGLLNDNPESVKVVNYKKAVNELLERPAFWVENTLYRQFVNVDETNKVLVIRRVDKTQDTNEDYYILINLSSKSCPNYAIGVEKKGTYEVVLDSDAEFFAGTNTSMLNKEYESTKSSSFAHFSWEIKLNNVAPYHVVVLKRK
ncbi:alpha amylase C-terminal domain-containing protein [Candidatus Woesearchaeota archaeon]|nr:alpha amylase C-terminal domain-containing protein [Candidatus Woesearchaeota archaeon]